MNYMKLLPIYLNEKTLSWIESRLNKSSEKDFIADMLKKDIQSAKTIQEKQESCEHVEGHFTGKKKCCAKCDSFYEAGCFESWTFEK